MIPQQTGLQGSWFANHIKEVTENAGDRYTPELDVNLPIARIFEGLGRTSEFFTEIDSLHKEIKKAILYLCQALLINCG
jgi:hypothetical protein